jgi:hypothetical protein
MQNSYYVYYSLYYNSLHGVSNSGMYLTSVIVNVEQRFEGKSNAWVRIKLIILKKYAYQLM